MAASAPRYAPLRAADTPSNDEGLIYSVRAPEQLGELQPVFAELSLDDETADFLDECRGPTPWQACRLMCARPLLRLCCRCSRIDANAFLGTGRMFVLSTGQAERLLSPDGAPVASLLAPPRVSMRTRRLLDIGAGDGNVTARIAAHFDEVVATEVTVRLVASLRERHGFRAFLCDDIAALPLEAVRSGFDVIACLNVMDRCDRPLTLLKQMRDLLRPDGLVLLATPFPFHPSVEREGGRWGPPTELIELGSHLPPETLAQRRWGSPCSCCPARALLGWEESARLFAKHVLRPAGFAVRSVSRVPYLSEVRTSQRRFADLRICRPRFPFFLLRSRTVPWRCRLSQR
jgi:SAM-dependent methyltransferase